MVHCGLTSMTTTVFVPNVYTKITRAQMEAAIREVYEDMPELLDEVLNRFRRHWKGTK